MSSTILQIVYTGLFFLIIFITGFWLTFAGKPYNGIVLAVHKLISLAALVFLGFILYRVNQVAGLSTLVIILAVLTVVFFLANIITGGMLSSDLPPSALVLTLHFVTPYLTVISSAAMLTLLIADK